MPEILGGVGLPCAACPELWVPRGRQMALGLVQSSHIKIWPTSPAVLDVGELL